MLLPGMWLVCADLTLSTCRSSPIQIYISRFVSDRFGLRPLAVKMPLSTCCKSQLQQTLLVEFNLTMHPTPHL